MDKLEEILRILGKNIRRIITNADIDITKLSEIRLRSFMPLIIRYDGRDLFITRGGSLICTEKYAYRVSSEDIKRNICFFKRLFCVCIRGRNEMRIHYDCRRTQSWNSRKGSNIRRQDKKYALYFLY